MSVFSQAPRTAMLAVVSGCLALGLLVSPSSSEGRSVSFCSPAFCTAWGSITASVSPRGAGSTFPVTVSGQVSTPAKFGDRCEFNRTINVMLFIQVTPFEITKEFTRVKADKAGRYSATLEITVPGPHAQYTSRSYWPGVEAKLERRKYEGKRLNCGVLSAGGAAAGQKYE